MTTFRLRTHVCALNTREGALTPAPGMSAHGGLVRKIAISYRRSDSQSVTGHIHETLADHFGVDEVFMDIDAIPMGVDFRHYIDGALENAAAVVVVIGTKWLGSRRSGRRRIEEETDPVRVELETAFRLGRPIFPILVEGARMPEPSDLPATLKKLSFINAAIVDSGRDYRVHMERVVRALDEALRLDREQRPVTIARRESEGQAADAARRAEEPHVVEAARHEREQRAAEAVRRDEEKRSAEAARREKHERAAQATQCAEEPRSVTADQHLAEQRSAQTDPAGEARPAAAASSLSATANTPDQDRSARDMLLSLWWISLVRGIACIVGGLAATHPDALFALNTPSLIIGHNVYIAWQLPFWLPSICDSVALGYMSFAVTQRRLRAFFAFAAIASGIWAILNVAEIRGANAAVAVTILIACKGLAETFAAASSRRLTRAENVRFVVGLSFFYLAMARIYFQVERAALDNTALFARAYDAGLLKLTPLFEGVNGTLLAGAALILLGIVLWLSKRRSATGS